MKFLYSIFPCKIFGRHPTSTETFIILDGRVRYARKNSEYISYENQDVLIKPALASQKAPVHGFFSHENGEPAVSYGFDNYINRFKTTVL